MYCPNCGNRNSTDQKFCRSCGLGLQKVAQTLSEQLPTKLDVTLQQKKERFEKLGVAALSIFGAGVLAWDARRHNSLGTYGSLGFSALFVVGGLFRE